MHCANYLASEPWKRPPAIAHINAVCPPFAPASRWDPRRPRAGRAPWLLTWFLAGHTTMSGVSPDPSAVLSGSGSRRQQLLGHRWIPARRSVAVRITAPLRCIRSWPSGPHAHKAEIGPSPRHWWTLPRSIRPAPWAASGILLRRAVEQRLHRAAVNTCFGGIHQRQIAGAGGKRQHARNERHAEDHTCQKNCPDFRSRSPAGSGSGWLVSRPSIAEGYPRCTCPHEASHPIEAHIAFFSRADVEK